MLGVNNFNTPSVPPLCKFVLTVRRIIMDNQTISADDSENKIYIFPDHPFTGIQHYMHTIPDISCFAVIAFGKVGLLNSPPTKRYE